MLVCLFACFGVGLFGLRCCFVGLLVCFGLLFGCLLVGWLVVCLVCLVARWLAVFAFCCVIPLLFCCYVFCRVVVLLVC